VAATGLLGINPYQKGVVLDISSKPVNFAIQTEQKNEAKREALDKYFMDYEKSLNPAGMRTQDQDAFLKKLSETKQYYLKNKDKILNPAKYGAEAQSQLMAGYKDVLSTIDKSKQRAAEDKVLAPFIIDARKNNRTIPQDVLDALERNKLSIADPNHVGFDPLSFDAYDKHDPFKYQQGIYSRIKPSESMPERLFDKKNNEITYKTVNDISNKSFGEIQNVVASELQKDRGLIDTVTEIARDQNRLNQLAQVFKDFSGKQMNPNSLQDVATAYTISLKPEAQVKYTTPKESEAYGRMRGFYNQLYLKNLDTSGQDNPLHPSVLINEIRNNNPDYTIGGVETNNPNLIDVTNQFGGYNLYKTKTRDGILSSPASNVVYDKANDRFYIKAPSKNQEPEYLTPEAFKTKIIVNNPDISSKIKGWGSVGKGNRVSQPSQPKIFVGVPKGGFNGK
jgi:hypothetical protein